MACDDLCRKIGMKIKIDTWWWSEDVKQEVSRRKCAHGAMCRTYIEENGYKSMKNNDKKVFLKEERRLKMKLKLKTHQVDWLDY